MHEMDLFFITKTRSPEAVVEEEFEWSPWNNWPLSGTSRGQTKKWRKAEEKGSRALLWERWEWRLERCQRKVSDCAPDPLHAAAAASASVRLIGTQSREGSMGVSVTRNGGSCCLSPAMLNLHCWLGIDWRTSERDRHTVTGKMNCHLAFLNRLAASNWPLWTMWRDTDWVLPPPPFLPSLGRRQGNFKSAGSPCKVSSRWGGHQDLGSRSVTLHQSLVGFPILPRHPSLFHCAASLLWLSAGLVFLMAYSHGALTGKSRRKTIRGSHLDPGGNPRVY